MKSGQRCQILAFIYAFCMILLGVVLFAIFVGEEPGVAILLLISLSINGVVFAIILYAFGDIAINVENILIETKMKNTSENNITKKSFCSKCGQEVFEGEKFCSNCGKELNE